MNEDKEIRLLDWDEVEDPPVTITFKHLDAWDPNYYLVLRDSTDLNNPYRVIRLFSHYPPPQALKCSDTEIVTVTQIGLDLFDEKELT